jgi:hypothetical protein
VAVGGGTGDTPGGRDHRLLAGRKRKGNTLSFFFCSFCFLYVLSITLPRAVLTPVEGLRRGWISIFEFSKKERREEKKTVARRFSEFGCDPSR